MILVSFVSNTGSDTELFLRGRSFICIMNNGGPRIHPWGIPCFTALPARGKKISIR
jgi:hypothetical protein